MKSKKHQKLYDHYKEVFGQEPIFSLQLKKNVLPTAERKLLTKEQLSQKLRKKANGVYWLMEEFYTHDDDYKLISSKPFTTL